MSVATPYITLYYERIEGLRARQLRKVACVYVILNIR